MRHLLSGHLLPVQKLPQVCPVVAARQPASKGREKLLHEVPIRAWAVVSQVEGIRSGHLRFSEAVINVTAD